MWESPIYKFGTYLNAKRQDIFIDVTGSAPSFSEPGKQLEGTFDVLLEGLNPQKIKILDLGGGKLRNTIYLLKKGYTVYSCEFEDLFKRSKQAHEFLEEAKEFKNFKDLVFPYDLINLNRKFDVILLINVINIMPVPLERYYLLALCREKMKKNGKLLWYTQHGTYSEADAVARLFDGFVTGKGRKYNMFYRDFSREEIHLILKSTGFSYGEKYRFPMSGSNQAYVFIADGDIIVGKTLRISETLKKKEKRSLKPVERKTRWKKYETKQPTRVTKVKEINPLKTVLEELEKTPTGKMNASKYHNLIFCILKSVFEKKLRKPKKEEYIADDTQRVDITFSNHKDGGFFKRLAEDYKITCPNIFIECKNYKEDIKNPEFAQVHNRLNKVRGQFGILICRTINNYARVKKRQDDLVKDSKYVLVLTDFDIKKLVKWKLAAKLEEIDDYLEEKFKKLT